jgi:hypothetical protein
MLDNQAAGGEGHDGGAAAAVHSPSDAVTNHQDGRLDILTNAPAPSNARGAQ